MPMYEGYFDYHNFLPPQVIDKVEIVSAPRGKLYLVHEDAYTEVTQEQVNQINDYFFSMKGPPWLKELVHSDNWQQLASLRYWQPAEKPGDTKRLALATLVGHEALPKASGSLAEGGSRAIEAYSG